MKHEIIYTEDYALIVSDEKAKENDWGYIPFQGGEIKLVAKFFADDWKKVIAHRPLKDASIFKGLPLLPSFSCGQQDDVQKLALEMGLEYYVGGNYDFENGIRKGYNKAKETYQYTEEDLINFSNFVTTNLMEHSDSNGFYIGVRKVLELFKQIQKPKRPKYFTIKTTNMNLDEIREQGKGFLHANTDKPVIITNSQGQRELVGTYEGGEQ